MTADPSVTVVVPMLDADARMVPLRRWVLDLRDQGLSDAEIILVDDGSTDGTWAAIRALAVDDPSIRGLRLARNVGQTGALCAGFSDARGPVVVTVDDDLEAGPQDIVTFISAITEGADFASGCRVGRRSPVRMVGSWAYNRRLARWGLPFGDAGCGVNALTLALARRIAAEGWAVHQHRFKPRVATMADKIVEVPFALRETHGSHFSILTLGASWLDVEVVVGGLDPRRFAAGAVVAPAAVAAVAICVALRRPGVLPACLAITSTAAAVTSARLLALRHSHERRTRESLPFEVADRTP